METVLAACLHVSGNSAGIVVGFHHDQARAKDHEEGEDVLLPGAADRNALRWLLGGLEFGFGYAHRCILPGAFVEDAVLGACGAFASIQTQASGILGSPVGIQRQARETVFGTKCSLLFMVPPRAAGTRIQGPSCHNAGRAETGANGLLVREGESKLQIAAAHTL